MTLGGHIPKNTNRKVKAKLIPARILGCCLDRRNSNIMNIRRHPVSIEEGAANCITTISDER